MFYEVIPTRIFGKGEVLTYCSDQKLSPGQIVKVPFSRSTIIGVVLKKVVRPDFECKKIEQILYSIPLPSHLLKTVQFVADYYLVPLPVALSLVLPIGVDKARRKKGLDFLLKTDSLENAFLDNQNSDSPTPKTEQSPLLREIPLNTAQKKAQEGLEKAKGATKLLLGVTGSGKTNIYLSEAKKAFKQQKSVILLVPEIALTSQLVRVFSEYFGDQIVLIHSGQTESERHQIFDYLLKETSTTPDDGAVSNQSAPIHKPSATSSPAPKIVIGPRSALFAPLSNLGLIIIDEAHESTYSQENTPKYSAIRVASFMAKNLKIPCILGSATPNLVDYYMAKKMNSLILLTKKAKETATIPDIKIIDFKERDNFSKNRYFSNALLSSISKNLENGTQTLIFHNRRGSSPLTICEHCGAEVVCPNCFLPLTLHADTYQLICHTCDYKTAVPTLCPTCHAPGELIHKGFGTKLLETELQRLFKSATIRRFDGDTKKGETLESVYDEVKNGAVDILIGTQTLAKGLDLPKLATVGVVQADAGLSLPDFSAEERTFELLTQVIGRVGRGHLDTAEVVIQTFRPDHPVLKYALAADYLGFFEYLLKRRASSLFPPFTFILKCEITLKTEKLVLAKIQKAWQMLSKMSSTPSSTLKPSTMPELSPVKTSISESSPVKATISELSSVKASMRATLLVSPPMPAFHEHTSKGYTWELIVRARSRGQLVEVAKLLTSLDPNFRLTLDPPSLL